MSTLDKDICENCWLTLPWLLSSCHQCGRALDVAHTEPLYCGECLKHPPYYDTTTVPLSYQDGMISLITKLKFYHNLAIARLMGELIADRVSANYLPEQRPTLLIPVPLHAKRLRARGYNQANLIALHISKLTKIPVQLNLCQRIRHTTPQSQTSAELRRSNIVGAFKINKPCDAQHIALIDDVMTTGATVNSLSQLLKQQGIQHISVWCAARA